MKILLLANTDWYLYNFRLGLAEALRARGDEVVLVSPAGPYAARLIEKGFHWISFPLDRRGMNPFVEANTVLRLAQLYRQEKPALVHHFTIKCVLYGSLAARLAGIRSVVNSVEGLGYVFTGGGAGRKMLQGIVKMLYRLALKRTQVVFLNPDDRDFFLHNRLAKLEQTNLSRGAGVDLQRFTPAPQPEGVPLVILPARMLWDKGLKEFAEAARILKAEGVQARFALVGDRDPDNPASVDAVQLKQWEQEAVIEWWGWQEEMEKVYAQAAVVCLPSYREGAPKTLIEAAASGRPIVTSDAAGCGEVVRQGLNGLLVPPQDAVALAEALRQLIGDRDLRIRMGRCSRQLAEEEFSSASVNAEIFKIYGLSSKNLS